MHIAVDIRLLTTGNSTGVEEYTRHLVGALLDRRDGCRYTLVHNGFWKQSLPPRWRNHPRATLVERRIPNKLLDAALFLAREPHLGRFLPERPDLVFSPHLNIVAAPPGVPRVMVIHDLSFVHYPEFVMLRRRLWNRLQCYRERARTADAVVAVSECTARDVRRTLGVADERVRVVYPGRNPSYGPPGIPAAELESFRAAHPELAATFLLTVGTVEPRKNHRALIRAFALLKERREHRGMKLVIVGQRGWKCDTILSEARASPVRNDIVWWGAAREADLRCLYSLARVFAYPSWFEGFGFPPLEAMASGVPVVVSNRSSLPEVVSGAALAVDPWNVDELAWAIGLAAKDASVRERLMRSGRRAAERFSWERAASDIVGIFDSISAVRR